MSVGARTLVVPPRFEPARRSQGRERSALTAAVIRAAAFGALALYAVSRWAELVSPAPALRLLGLVGLAVMLVGAVPPLRRFGTWAPALLAVIVCLLALPVAGLPWQLFIHHKLARSANFIGDGLAGLPGALLPYAGSSHRVGVVITMGAAVLLLDAAIVLAFAPAALGDLRRGGAALPLLALAVIPATLVRPALPYAQGLILFALLAAFLWAERLRRETLGVAVVLAAVAGLAGAALAPRIDARRAWFDYRNWAGSVPHVRADRFIWNQTYGPLHWPRHNHVVLTVYARGPDYWKAENLDLYNGHAWVAADLTSALPPQPSNAALTQWSQTIRVRIGDLSTRDVIGAGYSSDPSGLAGTTTSGLSEGTWRQTQPLTPGTTYVVNTYSPHPTAAALAGAGRAYPRYLLDDYRTIEVPEPGLPSYGSPVVIFPRFGHRREGVVQAPARFPGDESVTATMARSPYAGVYRLARRLATGARTPYALVMRVRDYLLAHYTYNESPPLTRYPLVTFLLGDKLGYCQQFSGAMALLLRMDGLPARVSTGFTSGTRQGRTGPYVVSDIDAHAWVEVWFPHYGWVRFDPTPPSAPELGGRASLPLLKTLPGSHTGGAPTARRGIGETTTSTSPRGPHRSIAGNEGAVVAAAAILVLVLALWLVNALSTRPGGGEARLVELERAWARTGRPLVPGVTLVDLEHRLRDSPEAAAYLRALRLERYRDGAARAGPRGGRRALRAELRRGLGRGARLRALWALPPSVPAAPAHRAEPVRTAGPDA